VVITLSEKNKINVTFHRSQDYKTIASTGCWGGPTGSGDILCNFFVESFENPSKIELEVGPHGQANEISRIYPNGDEPLSIREIQVGILLNPNTARSIGRWLLEKADEVLGSHPKVQPSKK